jgi:hypothetical protein
MNKDRELDLNLGKCTDTAHPWNQSVSYLLNGRNAWYQAFYLPRNSLPCPKGTDCIRNDSANIWLCSLPVPKGDRPIRSAYGLRSNNLSMSVTGDYIFAGVDGYYVGNTHRFANVH